MSLEPPQQHASKVDVSYRVLEPIVRHLLLRDLNSGRAPTSQQLQRARRGSSWRLYTGIACCIVIPLIPVGIGLLVSHMLSRGKGLDQSPDVRAIADGRLRLAWVVMANSGLTSGQADVAPALVLACVDDGPDPSDDHMMEIIERLCLTDRTSSDPLDRQLAAIMDDDRFRPHRRRQIPEPLARGRALYAFDVPLVRAELVEDLRKLPWVPCLIEPGITGGVFVVPAAVLQQAHEAARQLAC